MGGVFSHADADDRSLARSSERSPRVLLRRALPFASEVAALVSNLPVGPREIVEMRLDNCQYSEGVIGARLETPSAQNIYLYSVQPFASKLPIEIVFSAGDSFVTSHEAACVSRCIDTHVILIVNVVSSMSLVCHSVQVSARPSGNIWIARALLHPASWADAVSVTVVSISFATSMLPCECLPAHLPMYRCVLAPPGKVYVAARRGDVVAIKDALYTGGSTEEADSVSMELGGGPADNDMNILGPQLLLLQFKCTALYWAARYGHFEIVKELLTAGANPTLFDLVSMGEGIPWVGSWCIRIVCNCRGLASRRIAQA